MFVTLRVCHYTVMVNVFRSEDLVIPEEPGVEGLGWPVPSNRETPEGKTSSQTGRPDRPGIATYKIYSSVIVTIYICYISLYY